MRPQADPKVDFAFKHVFGREQNIGLLMSLLDAILQPSGGQGIASLEIMNPFNDKDTLDDKLSILDIKARDQVGRQFNIEMQMLAYGAFRQRALYYWARLHQGQLRKGEDFRVLRPTIAVCFVDTPLFPALDDYHLIFELRERRHQALFTDQMAVHILELPKFTKTVEQLATPLDRWLYFLRHARDLDADALPSPLDLPELRFALGDLIMISQSKRDHERYESRQKMQRDVYTALAEAEEIGEARGLEKGILKGIEQGREEGQAEGRRALIESFQKLLRREAISREQLQRLSLPELEELAARLQTELNARLAGDA
ncbi:MAG TPA: Rpn family recombination-promoting nuclease/putative transposase [Pirellulales bacterium]|nr:Rpn family recombination-promoting nuclease/putative transposase [Pirellulales bacterium]